MSIGGGGPFEHTEQTDTDSPKNYGQDSKPSVTCPEAAFLITSLIAVAIGLILLFWGTPFSALIGLGSLFGGMAIGTVVEVYRHRRIRREI